jgi:hypothetical protein
VVDEEELVAFERARVEACSVDAGLAKLLYG